MTTPKENVAIATGEISDVFAIDVDVSDGMVGESNDFCRKIPNGTKNPKSSLTLFRNGYYPRIAVTVDMIATGTDMKPLECLLLMRDVKSKNYFEQMKGRDIRVVKPDDLNKASPSAWAKTHYVIIDALGVTKSLKTSSQPLVSKPSIPFWNLAMRIKTPKPSRRSSRTT
ncbi:hypothetical protein [Leisingera sp.]|uniref:hypothetical protein n=1 Tax=Leisingera sp. TaxID=1879318 RepID=UPI002B268101|nr:hypothetical protein [Leisingera sp.]